VKLQEGKGCQRQKNYKEDDDQYVDEIEVTVSRKLVEVYQEDFDDNQTDDVGHKSLEKEGNCTVIQKANIELMQLLDGHLQSIYSKEKCDDSIRTTSYLNVLTSHTR
jgi:hypothetical protein